ncbi:alpha/beta hydrolase [Flammeovirga sp. SubArs3]|uniref:alpha/beta fold hydrolase n=1 Tax=Flammeovirga sp. SubArs3 TaxID=2995316 RepID=UPI00248BBBFB|nr:alpha/beta hydrolase [Flammeovirga sp. SubArs3]
MKLYLLPLLATLIGFTSCNRNDEDAYDYKDGEFFYLENKGAFMPVWVVGNVDSGIFIITNHGGPGYDSGMNFHTATESFQQLEKEYALVYWDQRMAGSSKGNPSLEDLTIEQHVEDLEKLVTLIEHKYAPKSMFMYGHSWGGGLSILYMGKDENQSKFNGWIDEDGAIQDKYEMELKREWIVPRAEAKYEATDDKKWKEVIQWWEDHPNPNESMDEPYQHVRMLEGYIYDKETSDALHNNSVFEQRFLASYSFGWLHNQYEDFNFMAHYDFMPRAKNIIIPTLLIWGKEDGAVPVAVSDTVYSLVNTPIEDKYKVQLDECAHAPHWEKPYIWTDEVRAFIEEYK